MSSQKQSRRDFLEKVAWGVAGAAIADGVLPRTAAPSAGEMPYRILGRSGEKVSLVGLGGFHIGIQSDEADSIRLIRTTDLTVT